MPFCPSFSFVSGFLKKSMGFPLRKDSCRVRLAQGDPFETPTAFPGSQMSLGRRKTCLLSTKHSEKDELGGFSGVTSSGG